MELKDFQPCFPVIIDLRTMNPDVTRREAFRFTDELCEMLDDMYDEIYVGSSGNLHEMLVVSYFTKEEIAKEFRRLWDKGQRRALQDHFRSSYPDDPYDVPF